MIFVVLCFVSLTNGQGNGHVERIVNLSPEPTPVLFSPHQDAMVDGCLLFDPPCFQSSVPFDMGWSDRVLSEIRNRDQSAVERRQMDALRTLTIGRLLASNENTVWIYVPVHFSNRSIKAIGQELHTHGFVSEYHYPQRMLVVEI